MTSVPALLVNESGVAQAWSTDLNHQGVCDILNFFAIRSWSAVVESLIAPLPCFLIAVKGRLEVQSFEKP